MLQGKRFGSNKEVIAETQAYSESKVSRLRETMLVNKVEFPEKTVFFLVRTETY